MQGVKVCDECKKATRPIICRNNPKASEWYCPHCHKSYPMSIQDFQVLQSQVK